PQAISQQRLVWLRCIGVPLHLWNLNFFTRFAERWELLISMDASTSSHSSLAVARMLILTTHPKTIDGTLPVRWRLEEFFIRVCEERSGVDYAFDWL
ncbi:hypothetical protein Ancab_002325, partial [Ancistrocladus abbreviatus]